MTLRRNTLLLGGSLILVVAAAVVGWFLFSHRHRPNAGDPARYAPHLCGAVLEIPSLDRLGVDAHALSELKTLQMFLPDLLGPHLRLLQDPKAALQEFGLDPARPLFAHLPGNGGGVAVVPVSNFAAFEAKMKGYLAQGAPIVYRQKGADVLLAFGPQAEANLAAALAQKPETSLAEDERFRATRERFIGRDLLFFACPGSPQTQFNSVVALPYGLAESVTVRQGRDHRELVAELELPLGQDLAKDLTPPHENQSAPLLARLDPNAFAWGHFAGNVSYLKPLIEQAVPRPMMNALTGARIDFDGELLANLEPGVAAAFSLPPTPALETMPTLDPRSTNPFQLLRFEALGRLKDAAKAEATLAKLEVAAPHFAARTERTTIQDVPVLAFKYRLGEGLKLGVTQGLIAAAGGDQAIENLLTRLHGVPPSAAAIAPLTRPSELAAVHLDIAKLVAALRALPDSVYGIGGFAVKDGLQKVFDLALEFPSLDVTAVMDGQTLRVELVLGLAPPARTP